jgi:hypothetical protein
MSKAFKIGERAIVVKSLYFPEVIGREITVAGPLELHRNSEGDSWFGYSTDYERDGAKFCPRPHYLKKKTDLDGPMVHDFAKKGSWDKVGWVPSKDRGAKVTAPENPCEVA